MKINFVENLELGQKLSGESFFVKSVNKSKTQAGKEYWNLLLGDKTGQVSAKVWADHLSDCHEAQTGQIVSVSGSVQEFKGNKQIIVESLSIAQDYDESDFMGKSKKNIDDLYKIVEKNIFSIKNEYLKKLIDGFFGDSNFEEKFKKAPGAERIHHAYLGGLLEHVTEMLNLASLIAEDYPVVDHDLLICGVLLHDIGKMEELEINGGIKRTIGGKLVGHLPLGFLTVAKKIDSIKNFPDNLKYKLHNLILSHHGKREFGSPMLPMSLEAVILYRIDELSSKANVAAEEYERGVEASSVFSEKIFALDNTELYIGDDRGPEQTSLI
ncbi:MAG TPA: HD domain-containing protein [Candidatus Bipolaricaulota bacterium]|nr:HD domain-containing protein [Candidatus Bipolaricaulota bacterium]